MRGYTVEERSPGIYTVNSQVARNLARMGLALEKVVEATELDIETVKSLYPQK